MTATPNRKYAMTRLGSGDYLLPSNDGETLWRLCLYEDDDRKVWGLWRWEGAFPTPDSLMASLETEDWTLWQFWSGPFATRNDVIVEALG